MTLYGKALIKDRVRIAWEKVFCDSGKVLRDAEIYGFALLDKFPDPNIHQMLVTLRILDGAMAVMIDHKVFGDLDHDDMRLLLNAREQVQRMERVAIALRQDDEVAFEKAISAMETQAAF